MSGPPGIAHLAVLAFDYDGTLAREGRLAATTAEALAGARRSGLRLVLVTGRVLEELRRVCPDAEARFDCIVAENGAVLAEPGAAPRLLAPPVDRRLAEALRAQGLRVWEGRVLLALHADHEEAVRRAADAAGLDIRLSRNRDALMVLPASVSKASGLSHALARLGADARSTLAVGDAENDREMLESVGWGVAVGDAVESLKAVADEVLTEPNGAGVEALLARLQPRA